MDRKTFTQFLLVCAAILVCWWVANYLLYGPAGKPAAGPQGGPAPQQPAPAPQAQAPAAEARLAALPAQPQAPAPPVETEQLENNHLKLVWTNRGASLRTLTLLDAQYRAPYYENDKRPPLTLLSEFQEGMSSDTIEKVTFVTQPNPQAPVTRSDVPTANLIYRFVERDPDKLVFEQTVSDDQGHALLIRKTVSLPADSYNYEVSLEFQNVCDVPYSVEFALRGAAGIEREVLQPNDVGTRVAVGEKGDYKIFSRPAQKLDAQDSKPNESTKIAWAAVINHYFVAVTIPADGQWVSNVASDLVVEDELVQASGRWDTPALHRMNDRRALAANAAVVIHTVPLALKPGGSARQSYILIAAPKDRTVLVHYNAGMEGLIEFGFFSAISRVALAILNGIHAVLPNYGIAILVLTVVVRVLLFPLTRKQLISMIKMQKLQPQIAELQRQYADDKQKLSQEQMGLFKKYGVHPLGGCGPMLLQFPVLLALWRALNAAIELRHVRFLWIPDLSRPDTIYHLPFTLPVLGDELNLLPFLMAAVTFWQQKGMPTGGGDQAQQQQKIMKWFPLLFVLMFYHMSSGLVLYWTATSALSLVERWVINRHADAIELKPKGERKPRPQPGGKPGPTWLDKLQKMVGENAGSGQQRKGKK